MTGAGLSSAYQRWAAIEANGVSAIYEAWAPQIARNPEALRLLNSLPSGKRQPNLVFAASRWCGMPADSGLDISGFLASRWDQIRPVILERSTQTNEAARCATLSPAVSTIAGPIALIEVGASAGLCLLLDKYSYRYRSTTGTAMVDPPSGISTVVLECEVDEWPTVTHPEIVWRAGIDLNPIDVASPDNVAWLETLVWPEHAERQERLRAALEIAAADPPRIVAGDAVDDLKSLASDAPPDATLVVFHSAVLSYLSRENRHRFAATVGQLDAVWISNEGSGVLPLLDRQVTASSERDFIVGLNGIAVGLAGPHGQSYRQLPHA